MMTRLIKSGAILMLLCSAMLWSCKDDTDSAKGDDSDDSTSDATRSELTLDSIFYYAKETYLWYDQLPEYDEFDPRGFSSYTDMLDNLNAEVYELSQYAINPDTGEPYEYLADYDGYAKYSFVEENESATARTAATSISYLDGTDDDFGFALTAIAADDIRIRYATKGSPAYEAGLRRGDQLLEVDGEEVTADNQSDINLIVNTFDESTYPLKVQKADGTTLETTLVKTTYTIVPVAKDSVYVIKNKNVGYMVFDMFSSLSNAQSSLDDAFDRFSSAGVTDLIVDLRYNGGGYLETADYMINNIIPSSYNNQEMYTEQFNDLMQSGDATILKNLLLLDDNGDPISYNGGYATYNDIDYSEDANTYTFDKEGSLNTVQNVYFIMTGSTASASELVMNTLRPYLNVTMIGSTSYGKPVGFFGIDIDEYTMYMPNFRTINSNGESDYYAGFDPDVEADDDVTKDFGDLEEESISIAVEIISGTYNSRTSARTASGYDKFNVSGVKSFTGMIAKKKTVTP